MSWPSFADCPPLSHLLQLQRWQPLLNPFPPPANPVYTNVSCGIWGLFITLLYLTAMATGVMASTVWRWKGSCGQWPPRVLGPSFLCSDCSGLARLSPQTDGGVISDFIADWAISYKLIFHSSLIMLKGSRCGVLEPGRRCTSLLSSSLNLHNSFPSAK